MDKTDVPGFVFVDYAIFGVTIVISLGIGIYYAIAGGRQKTTTEYLLGNRQMKVLPVALSLMVSFESSIMMLGYPAEIYSYGFMFWITNFGFMITLMIGARIIVPLFHPLGIKSVYEYFQLRYKGRAVRLLGSFIGMIFYVFYMGIVLFGPGIALEAVTDMPFWASVISVAVASVLYTSIGGIKAVIWTDVFQSLIMLLGVVAVLIKGTIESGGAKSVIDINSRNNRFDIFDFNPDPTIRHTFWTCIVGYAIIRLGMTFNQSTIQRICSTRTKKDATKVMLFSGPAFFVTQSLAVFEGVVAFAYYYTKGCDPLKSKKIKNANQLLPYMVQDIFRSLPGMSGLFMASLFSASLSTMSSGLNSLSAMTTEDYIKPYYKLSDTKLTLIAKLCVPVYGLLSIGVSFMIATIHGPMSQIATSILTSFSGPVTGLFLYSVFFPWATKKGALVGTTLSVVLSFWLSAGKSFSTSLPRPKLAPMPPTYNCFDISNTTIQSIINTTSFTVTSEVLEPHAIKQIEGVDKYYSISYLYVGALGIAYTIVLGIIVSLLEGLPKSSDVDVRYVLPFFDLFFPFLPKTVRQKLYFGVPFENRKFLLEKMNKGTRDYEDIITEPERTDLCKDLIEKPDTDNALLCDIKQDNNELTHF